MHSTDPLLEQANERPLYKRRRFPLAFKVLAVRIYRAGASLRQTTQALRYVRRFSYEALREWAQRFASLFRVLRINVKNIVVDETTIYLSDGREVFEWTALDHETRRVIFRWLTTGRGGLDALLFMKNVLRRVEGTPLVMVDRGVWYPWALNTLRVAWKVQRGGPRSLVESYFGSLKTRLRRMARRPQTWHTMTTLPGLLNLHAMGWNENH